MTMAPAQTAKDVVDQYIDDVLSRRKVVGRLVYLAVLRHKREYEAQLADGEIRGLKFDERKAAMACSFFPRNLRHSIGKWDKQPFVLSPWQMFVVWCVFGWRRVDGGHRRFRKVYISVGRKNGKSTLIAGLAVMLLAGDIPLEPGAQIYAAATKEDQAQIILGEAKAMIDNSPNERLREACDPTAKQVTIKRTRSFLRVLGSDSKKNAGWNPHGMLLDELHDWQEHHQGTWDALTTASGSRDQPIRIVITTAGDDDSVIWQAEDDFAVKVLEGIIAGEVVDDVVFAFVARIDDSRVCDQCEGEGCEHCDGGILPADDPLDESCWAKANPNLGESLPLSYLQEQANEARHKPTALNAFTRFHANRRCSSNERAVKMELWKRCSGPLSDWDGLEVYGAFDLGRKTDLASIALAAKVPKGADSKGVERYQYELRQWSFTHERAPMPLDREPWATYVRRGWLSVNDGDVIDLPGAVYPKILEVTETFNVVQWAFDPNNASFLAQVLQGEHGMEVYEFHQTHKHYNESLEAFLDSITDKTLRHGDDPLLTMAAQNLVINKSPGKNDWMPKKDSSTGKIDPIVAAIMAFGGAMKAEPVAFWNPAIGV